MHSPERLYTRAECATLFGLSPKGWDAYWKRNRDLRGYVNLNPGGQPRRRWPLSVIKQHQQRLKAERAVGVR